MGIMHTPEEVREFARTHEMTTTAGHARGYMQANLLSLPSAYAFDFLLFAQRNPKPCPIVGVLEAGQYTSDLLPGGDIRTDIPAYRIFEHGEHTATLADATSHYTPDVVSFLIGCSFTFETALVDAGIEIAHIKQQRNVPMYRTNIPTTPAGVFSGPMVVSMRPIPASQVSDAVRITSRYPSVHGAPVHVGDPAAIGIADLAHPDFGDAVDIPEGCLPVFWACGVTPQAIVMDSKPELAISHAPGKMLVTNARDAEYLIP
ncbi:putative hydro-lyase [Corynebacterium rhinophilum]|uniref:putative hydro-lyase n=1 Tax=Corynebacterium rhinophilum TaxID=3050197 RepID=UPI0025518202|nr:putative hydro-lyase [Corynebacterium sp. MSK090]MDK8704030.1 putative hydro-lyase [Corynebacterium sp. MSK090]